MGVKLLVDVPTTDTMPSFCAKKFGRGELLTTGGDAVYLIVEGANGDDRHFVRLSKGNGNALARLYPKEQEFANLQRIGKLTGVEVE